MITVSFIYQDEQDAQFNEEYYTKKHLPRVRELWEPLGLKQVIPFVRVINSPDFGPFRAISILTFDTLEQYHHALQNGGDELMQDVGNFTNLTPVAQISKLL